MARPDSPSDDESPRTGGAPTAAAFADTILERMAQKDAVQKATNEQLAAIPAILAPLAGNSGDPASTVRKQLFDIYRTAGAENTTNTNAAQVQTPGGIDLVTVRELAELKQSFLDMKERMFEGPTAAPLIERVLAETLKTPFSRRVTDVRYRPAEKIRLPTYAGKADPTDHITAFNIAMGPALGWFTGLERDSIHDFHDLTTAFLKQYIMFTRQGATLSDLWNLSQGANQSLRDFMEKFKTVASKVQIPDSVAVLLMNTLYFKSLFREDLYRNPTTSLQDAIARSNNFIRMEEDTAAILKKLNTAAKPATAPKAPEAHQEPRQHASGNKSNQPKSFVNVVKDKNPSLGSTVVVREKGWNVWENDERPQSCSAPSTSSPGARHEELQASGRCPLLILRKQNSQRRAS
ncbi:PREDICTED: uncharacterized protein LOC106330732 [Brassica oleracea var. oleracea]|uniref:uncharacterized protein LOC106330732 n=1 Tax=Brassica oleracea var. oleracea TaxID=109376 RepID=UPI0006A6F617|nr:PREDICTED: uncharacterized protein LOC106330732 [Brassica oleracea var. oleracea]